MFKHTLLAVSFTALISSTAMYADKPKTFMGKVTTSAIQTINKHPFISALPIAIFVSALAPKKTESAVSLDLITWLLSGIILESGTEAIMKNFDIDKAAQ